MSTRTPRQTGEHYQALDDHSRRICVPVFSQTVALLEDVVGIRPLAMSEWLHRRAKSNSRERVLQGPALTVLRWRPERGEVQEDSHRIRRPE